MKAKKNGQAVKAAMPAASKTGPKAAAAKQGVSKFPHSAKGKENSINRTSVFQQSVKKQPRSPEPAGLTAGDSLKQELGKRQRREPARSVLSQDSHE
jgi:hypothetical protein